MCGDDGCNRREITELAVSRLYSQYTIIKTLAVVLAAVTARCVTRSGLSLAVCIDSSTRSVFAVTSSSITRSFFAVTVSNTRSFYAVLLHRPNYFISVFSEYFPNRNDSRHSYWMKKMLYSLTVPNLISEIFLKQYLRSYDVRSSLAGSKACETSCELSDFFD